MKASEYVRRGWCQKDAAQDSHGNSVSALSPDAIRFCMIAAMFRALYDDGVFLTDAELTEKFNTLHNAFPCQVMDFMWNDAPGRTQAEVVARLEAYGY